MKTSKSISMMVIGMMIFGTTSSFGKTNNRPSENNFNNEPRNEMRVENRNNNGFNNDRGNGMMNNDRTYRMDSRDIRRNNPQPVPEPRHMEPRHNDTTSKVVTGVVLGTVVGGIISSLVH